MWCQDIDSVFFHFVMKHACDGHTDRRTYRQTDGQNYDPQDRASIAASRGKKELQWKTLRPIGDNIIL